MPSPTFAKYSVLKILTISATIFYSKEEKKNPLTGLSSYETAQKAVRECHYFIDDFDHKPKIYCFTEKPVSEKLF